MRGLIYAVSLTRLLKLRSDRKQDITKFAGSIVNNYFLCLQFPKQKSVCILSTVKRSAQNANNECNHEKLNEQH